MKQTDFSGTWVYNALRSSLQIPGPDSTTIIIEHGETRFRLQRTHVSGGLADTFTIELPIDGDPVQVPHEGIEIRARVYRERGSLVFDSTIHRDAERATNVVRYTLSDDGLTLIADERFRSPRLDYENRWVLDRGLPPPAL